MDGYARVSTESQSVATTDRRQLRQGRARRPVGAVLMLTELDRLARSTRALLNPLAVLSGHDAGCTSLGAAWADTPTPHGRCRRTVLGGRATCERALRRARQRGTCAAVPCRRGDRRADGA
jgi:DNA invertase Pin-like site-specific DNA recombinase